VSNSGKRFHQHFITTAMNRRSFISKTAEAAFPPEEQQSAKPVDNPYANKILPNVDRTTAGLEQYTGAWGVDQVAHLLRRTMFGTTKADVNAMMAHTLDELVEILLTDVAAPNPPLNVNSGDTAVPIGQTWVNVTTNSSNSARNSSLTSWWIGLMLGQGVNLTEKMTLFWQNHFVSETDVVSDARFSYRQLALFRQYAMGNFKTLTKQVTIDGAMLRYLNGNTNTKTNPNENYGRELQELFTIGKGAEIAPGNYTNFTEADVQAAAKVLTGWRENGSSLTTYFTLSRHDTTNKQFSADYGNTVITGSTDATGNAEIDALLTMIFNQNETANFICRKLYRWFVYYVIDATTETNVILPLANILRANNFEIKPVLRTLLKSAHFFDPVNVGCIIKDPIDLIVGMCRQFSVLFPDTSVLTKQYSMWSYLKTQSSNMQMDLINQPNVAGWPAYYQIPQYYELWINSDTLPKRNQFTDTLIRNGYTSGGYTLVADPIAFAQLVSVPSDPNVLINEIAQLLFPIQITDNQKAFLKGTLIPGLPDYEWTIEWYDYLADPTNAAKKAAVKSKLQALFSFMMDMAEYQLM
jgi:uncharacterized protein (DUF1800 family)